MHGENIKKKKKNSHLGFTSGNSFCFFHIFWPKICMQVFSYTSYMPCPFHPQWIDYPYIVWGVGRDSSVGIATGYGLDGPGIESRWGRDFCTCPLGPGAHPVSCAMGTGSFPGLKSDRGLTLTPHPLLVPWSRKSRAISLLPLWAVRPVQSLSPCTRVHFVPPPILCEERCQGACH